MKWLQTKDFQGSPTPMYTIARIVYRLPAASYMTCHLCRWCVHRPRSEHVQHVRHEAGFQREVR